MSQCYLLPLLPLCSLRDPVGCYALGGPPKSRCNGLPAPSLLSYFSAQSPKLFLPRYMVNEYNWPDLISPVYQSNRGTNFIDWLKV